jgi:hypothetical protein
LPGLICEAPKDHSEYLQDPSVISLNFAVDLFAQTSTTSLTASAGTLETTVENRTKVRRALISRVDEVTC